MALASGSQLGPYEITAHLDAGGMGEVYLAIDRRLKRNVAVKVLPETFASDPQRLARFQREAEVLASLNHPNIAHVYGLEHAGETPALVMELVEGPTLADRLSQGALAVAEALAIATQIAEALEAAHERGIIHRDLKPSNIKGPAEGTVKVLDFGLAKVLEPTASASGASDSAVITSPAMTQMGMMLGTAAYMAPEQAKGREADRRSDVWAFGAVLYEMLSGRRAFDGEDMSETIAAVLKSEPDWTLLPRDLPPAIRTLIQRCLVKDRRQRVADISTAKFVLNDLSSAGATAMMPNASSSRARWHWLFPATAAAVLTAIAVGTAAWALRPTPNPPALAQFSFTPEGQSFSGAVLRLVALSPDGKTLAYTANGQIYVRHLDELDATAIPDTKAHFPLQPLFSPDGQAIVFASVVDGVSTLKRVPLSGGAVSTLATFEGNPWFSGLHWSSEGILTGALRRGILKVPPTGGVPQQMIAMSSDEMAHGPQLLPDGRTVLFTLATLAGDDRWDKSKIVAQSLSDGTRRVLIEGADGRYVASGHLVYAIGGTIYAAPFDVNKLAVTGPAVPMIRGVRRATGAWSGVAHFAISDTGTVAYVPGPATAISSARALVVGDGRSDPALLNVAPASYVHPRASPDGLLLAVGRNEGQSSEIWTYELSGKSEIKRLTFGGNNRFPVWSGDGQRVAFQSSREGDRAIWGQALRGGTAERLTKPAQDEEHVPDAWSRDGTRLLVSVLKGLEYSLWVLTLRDGRLERFGSVSSPESFSATFSPDGRWVAYALTERAGGVITPNRGIFIEPYPPTGERHQVPKRLIDFHPVWGPDGKTIFYVPGSGQPAVAVPITTHPAVAFGTPIDLPQGPLPGLLSLDLRGYDILPDGRFISVAPVSGELPASGRRMEIRLILNWFEDLKRRVPVK